MKAAKEIQAAFNDRVSYAAIAKSIGKSDRWVRSLVKWADSGVGTGTDLPFSRNQPGEGHKDVSAARKVMADPEQRKQVLKSLSWIEQPKRL